MRIASPLGSGIECVKLTNSTSNGATWKRPPSGTSLIGSDCVRPYSPSFVFTMPAVKGVAKIGHSSDGHKSITAPMWSSWACVRTKPTRFLLFGDDEPEIRQHDIGTGFGVVRERNAQVDHQP